jgi:hypothetical protein
MAGDEDLSARSTLADVRGFPGRIQARRGRRAVLAVLAVVVALASVSLLGVHTSTASATAAGWSLRLDYPRIARSGLDITWRVQVDHVGGFKKQKEITLAVTGNYFDIFETQGFHPQPSKATRDKELMYLTFDAPPSGDTFIVDYDTYIQPSSQIGRSATLHLMDGQKPRLSLKYRTWLVP